MKKIFLATSLLVTSLSPLLLQAQPSLKDVKLERHTQPLSQIKVEDKKSLQLIKEQQNMNIPISRSNQFTYKILLDQLKAEQDEPQNFVFSPLSLINVMHLLSEGSSGSTQSQINQAIWGRALIGEYEKKLLSHWMRKSETKDSVSLWNANALWTNKDFIINKEYNDLVTQQYQATVRSLDFKNPLSKEVINAWVKSNTNQLIPSIVDELSPDDLLILTNAIYFKEIWLKPFNAQNTRKDIFYTEQGHEETSFMNGTQEIHYKAFNHYEEIGIPLRNHYVYYVLLPKQGVSIIDFLEETINNKGNLANTFNPHQEFMVSMPKMEIHQTLYLNEPLQRLGMLDMYQANKANFNKISTQQGLIVSEVLQKAYFKLSEEGAEGAAVTGVTMRATSAPILKEIKINRPFIYFIKNLKDNSTIFAGYINHVASEE